MSLRLYNTLTKRVEDFTPADPSRVTFYSCGPTVYDDAHIGNFRSFLAADVLRRWLESPLCALANETPEQRAHREQHGRRVVHVMNITDVGHMTDDAEGGEAGEDRMAVAGRRIAEAKKAGKLPAGVDVNPNDPYQIARFYEHRFKEDAEKLGLKVVIDGGGSNAKDDDARRVMHTPRATENVAGMVAVIQRLIERGCAYVAGSPGARVVYFDVQKFPPYGRLSGNTLDRLRAGAGGRVSGANQSQKRHPADFLLWKEDPRHIMKWPSPWGEGYPGWHIECTAMSVSRLVGPGALNGPPLKSDPGWPGAIIDLHSGGEDNIFPHHECEIAQSCCALTDSTASGTFARSWFHPRFLLVEGDKMSKSKGNFYTPRDLFAKGIEPAAIRLELIRTHYRSNANFTMQGLTDSQRMVERWRRIAAAPVAANGDETSVARCQRELTDAFHDDLNIAAALGVLNSWISDSASPGLAEQRLIGEIDAVLGVLTLTQSESETVPIGWMHDTTSNPGTRRQTRLPAGAYESGPLGTVYTSPGELQRPVAVLVNVRADDKVGILNLLSGRHDARAARDFKKSDAIRDELAAMGYAIKDLPGGKVEVRRA